MSDDLNTAAFERVLGGGGTPVDQFRAMGAALRSGERPNVVDVTNREVVGALFAMIRHYEAKGESANAVPPPLHVSPVPYSLAQWLPGDVVTHSRDSRDCRRVPNRSR